MYKTFTKPHFMYRKFYITISFLVIYNKKRILYILYDILVTRFLICLSVTDNCKLQNVLLNLILIQDLLLIYH